MSWLSVLALAVLLTIVLGLSRRSLRLLALAIVGGAACAAFGYAAASQHDLATLRVVDTFAAFLDNDITQKEFLIEVVSAPGWQWPALLGGYLLLWTAILAALLTRDKPPAITTALAFAWTSVATILGLEKCGAAEALVGWPAVEVCFGLASVLCAALYARIGLRKRVYFATMIVFGTVARVPAALFGTWATQNRLGTHFDEHKITFFANPWNQQAVEVAPGSYEQLAWLVWVPQLFVLPMVTFFMAGGIGFAVLMFVQHPPAPELSAAQGRSR